MSAHRTSHVSGCGRGQKAAAVVGCTSAAAVGCTAATADCTAAAGSVGRADVCVCVSSSGRCVCIIHTPTMIVGWPRLHDDAKADIQSIAVPELAYCV
jgi:hypothetical protein